MPSGLLKTVFPAETATCTSIITILYIPFMINKIKNYLLYLLKNIKQSP